MSESESEIKPAYDPEDWPDPVTEGLSEADAHWENAHGECMDRHQAAARALLGQPFGFTWEDVDMLRNLHAMGVKAKRPIFDKFEGLANRIAALLPPRDP